MLSFILAFVPLAQAVNIQVSGVLHAVCGSDLPCFTLTGQGFSLMHRQSRQISGNPAGFPGQDISLNAAPIVDGFSILTFQGINYLPALGDPSGTFGRLFGSLPVSTQPLRFPENPPQRVQLISPAVLSARLVGQNPVTNELVTFNLSGFGSATGVFDVCEGPQCSPPGFYIMQQIDYELTEIPEPSAWLLLITGLIPLWFARKQFIS
jgi:hypothetical protein